MKKLAVGVGVVGILAVGAFVLAKPQAISCSPSQTTTTAGTPVTLTASGGSGNYAWSAQDGTPDSGSGSSFTTSFSSNGTWGATVTDTKKGGKSATCTVHIGTPPMPDPYL